MATRFYLPSTGSAAVSPDYDSNWDDTGAAARLKCVTTKIGSAMTTVQDNDAGIGDTDHLFRQYVSDAIEAQTLSAQTVKFQMRALEAAAKNDAVTAISVRVVSNDGSTVRGTVWSLTRDTTELDTSLTNRSMSVTSTEVEASANDRIVIEVGVGGVPWGNGTHDNSISIGDDSGTDLGENDTDTAAYNPWVEFANTITFATGGGTTYNEATTIARYHTVSDATTLDAVASVSVSRVAGVSDGNDMTAEAAMSAARVMGVADSNVLEMDSAASIARYLAVSASGGLLSDNAVTLARYHTVTLASIVSKEEAIMLARIAAVSSGSTMTAEAATALSRAMALEGVAVLTADETLTLARTLSVADQAALIQSVTLTLASSRSITLSGAFTFSEFITLTAYLATATSSSVIEATVTTAPGVVAMGDSLAALVSLTDALGAVLNITDSMTARVVCRSELAATAQGSDALAAWVELTDE